MVSTPLYSVQLEGRKPVLKQLLQVKAIEEVKDQGSEVRVQRLEESEAATRKSEDVFYLAEITPSGNMVAVEETGDGRLNGGDKNLNAVL